MIAISQKPLPLAGGPDDWFYHDDYVRVSAVGTNLGVYRCYVKRLNPPGSILTREQNGTWRAPEDSIVPIDQLGEYQYAVVNENAGTIMYVSDHAHFHGEVFGFHHCP